MSAFCFRLSPPQRSRINRSPARVIDAVAGSPVDPQLAYAFADRLAVAEQAALDPVDARL